MVTARSGGNSHERRTGSDFRISLEPELADGPSFRVSATEAISLLWLAGLAVFIATAAVKAWHTAHRLIRRRCNLPAQLQSDIDALFDSLVVPRTRVWLITDAGQPFVWGLWRGDIYLPLNVGTMNSSHLRRDILAHEISHVLRHDAAANLLQVLAQAVFWFHPLVWWANAKIRREREKCCDEMAIARLGVQPRDYSRTIVEILLTESNPKGLAPSLAIAGPARNIEERIRTMLPPGRTFRKRPSTLTLACSLLLALSVVPTTFAITNRRADSAKASAEATAQEVHRPDAGPSDKNLEIHDVRFEPIHQGKNVVHVTVKNTSRSARTFATHIFLGPASLQNTPQFR